MTRTYERHFDWDKAKARYANGETIKQIADSVGVSWSAVQRIVKPQVRQRMAEHSKQLAGKGTCDRCGGPMSLNSRYSGHKHCRACASILRATTVRDTTLQCVTCKHWKPDDAFPHHKRMIARRGRHRQCTPCQTISRRERRHRNPEREREYTRAYKAKRRQSKQ